MLIDVYLHIEGSLDILHRTLDLHVHSVPRAARHHKAVRRDVLDYSVIILLARAEPRGEIRNGQEVTVGRTGGIVEFLQKTIQAGLVAHGQHDIEAQGLRGGQRIQRRGLTALGGVGGTWLVLRNCARAWVPASNKNRLAGTRSLVVRKIFTLVSSNRPKIL